MDYQQPDRPVRPDGYGQQWNTPQSSNGSGSLAAREYPGAPPPPLDAPNHLEQQLWGYGGRPTHYPLDPDVFMPFHEHDGGGDRGGAQSAFDDDFQQAAPHTGDLTADIPHPNGIRPHLPNGTPLQDKHYIIEGLLGQGGMGMVYKVRDTHLGVLRAMKEMSVRFGERGAELVNSTREAYMMMAQDHEGIPKVYDIFKQFDRSYIVLDYVDGVTLQDKLMRSATNWLTQEEVGRWMLQLAQIVEYLHSQQPPVIFRDLKPGNIMLTPDHRIVLIDFGIAKFYVDGAPQTTVGTEGFAAPEQRTGGAEPRSDVYALGAIMYYLLTRTIPQLPVSAYLPRLYNEAISPQVEQVIVRCMEYNPDHRFQSASEFHEALSMALGITSARIGQYTPAGKYEPHLADSRGWRRTADPLKMGAGHLTPLWASQTEGPIWGTPTILPPQQGQSGMIFIGSYDNNLHAFGLNRGEHLWMVATDGGICVKPVIWRNLVIFGSEDQILYALDVTNGKEKWRKPTLGAILTAPRIFNDILYVGSDDGNLYALNPEDGSHVWRVSTYSPLRSSVDFGNGQVYVGSYNGKLIALDALTGALKWNYPTQNKVVSSPYFADNYVYVGSMDYHIYCVEAKSGFGAWDVRTEREVTSSPIVVGDQLFIGSGDGRLYSINSRTGRRNWSHQTRGQVVSTPAYAEGVVYFGCTDRRVYALDTQKGRHVRWQFETGDRVVGSPIIYNGVVYIGSTDGYLYALRA